MHIFYNPKFPISVSKLISIVESCGFKLNEDDASPQSVKPNTDVTDEQDDIKKLI